MFGEEYEKEISKNPMLEENTISRRVQDMSPDVGSQAIANIKEADFVVIQFDEPTDVTCKVQILAFKGFVRN
jgi:hypothetical protein